MFEDVTRGEAELAGGPRWERFKQRFDDWKNEPLAGLARPLRRKLWGEMKQNADALSAARASGAIQLSEQFRAVKSDALPAIRLHLTDPSAGRTAHTLQPPRALKPGSAVTTITLLRPSVRIPPFHHETGP